MHRQRAVRGRLPQVFEVEDGVSRVLVEPVPPDLEDAARVAIETCPVSAIHYED